MSMPLLFKYELDDCSILFKGNVSIGHNNEIMIQYDTYLGHMYFRSLEVRKIKDSASEASHRMRIAARMFASLTKVGSNNQKGNNKSVSFAKHKTVQDFVEKTNVVEKTYVVPLDTKLVKKV